MELAGLSNLERLDLSNNQLSGEIPPEVGNLSKLTHLSLPGNQLSGQIPPELDKLTRLQFLDLEENQLSGCMSDFLREMGGTGLPVCAIDSEYPNAREALIAVYNALGAGCAGELVEPRTNCGLGGRDHRLQRPRRQSETRLGAV